MADRVGSSGGEATTIRTFLIADVRGYTLFTQERGDEAAAKLAKHDCACLGAVPLPQIASVRAVVGTEVQGAPDIDNPPDPRAPHRPCGGRR